MQAVVEGGTGWRARLPGVTVCGKTGTAQVVSKARLEKSPTSTALIPHGWFVAFAPAQKPRIALAVLVEHAGSGGEGAAPVAREILAAFFGLPASAPAEIGITDIETALD
jgi:penicillin-binding protein 2